MDAPKFSPSFTERVWHSVRMKMQPFLAPYRRKKINNTDFSIISNNCWGGMCYEYFGLPKLTPTVGSFLFPKDYLKLISNLHHYMNCPLEIINVKESNYADNLDKNISCPVGVVDDVEIFFLHYLNAEIAKEKWLRRVKRINYDNLIFKFSFMNGCTEEDIVCFDEMKLPGKKLAFVKDKNLINECNVYYPGFENEKQLLNDTFYLDKYFDLIAFINR